MPMPAAWGTHRSCSASMHGCLKRRAHTPHKCKNKIQVRCLQMSLMKATKVFFLLFKLLYKQ